MSQIVSAHPGRVSSFCQSCMEKHSPRTSSSYVQGDTNRRRENWVRDAKNRLIRGKEVCKNEREETDLTPYEVRLRKKIKEMGLSFLSTRLLFEGIREQGYAGSIRNVQKFVAVVREEERLKKGMPDHHKRYLIERARANKTREVSALKLFREIKEQGYRGSLRNVEACLGMVQENKSFPENCLNFHKDYLIKRLKETALRYLPTKMLLQEIKARGYRGSLKALNKFLEVSIQKQCPPMLGLHQDYLIDRMEKAWPRFIPTNRLFAEIRARGYLGSLEAVRECMAVLRRERENSVWRLQFHKNYLIERIKRASPHPIPPKTLFKEIKIRGYMGSLQGMQTFLKRVSVKQLPEKAFLSFHKNYLIEQFKGAWPRSIPAKQLFKDVQAKGYLGSFRTVQAFLTKLRKNQQSIKAM